MAVALPMETNPDTMNKYLQKLGVSNNWRMVDVVGLDDECLKSVPRPVLAVILLFPLSDEYEEHCRIEQEEFDKKRASPPKDVFHLKQVLSNVCGTIALVHSVANNTASIEINDGLLKDYLKCAEGLDDAAKGELLEQSTAILDAYRDIMCASHEPGCEVDDANKNHFVTFIHKDGTLFELDGRKSLAVNHGPTTSEGLLEDAVKVCRKFMEREPNSIGYCVMALVPNTP